MANIALLFEFSGNNGIKNGPISEFCTTFATDLNKITMVVPQKVKSFMMPITMTLGVIFGITIPKVILSLSVMLPYLVAGMLLVAYSKLHFKNIRIVPMHFVLIITQMLGALIMWKLFSYWNPLYAQQAFICIFCPIATSSPVVIGMLGGNLTCVVAYILFFYIGASFLIPGILPIVTGNDTIPFLPMSLIIAKQVMPMILLPLLITMAMKLRFRRGIHFLRENQSLAFYLWSICLTLVIGKATIYVMAEPANRIPTELMLAAISLFTCLLQFGVGHLIGVHYHENVVGTQSLGQKNTAMGLWMTFAYFNPLVSVGMAAYSIFQNSINSLQIYLYASKNK
jgi:BASS family bile acid:Na+ symporter